MDLTSMESFVILCRCRNFTRAAEQLYISQSALSKRIAGIERKVGLALIDRDSQVFTLTPFGNDFRKQCETVLNSYAQLEHRIEEIRHGSIRPLTVYHRHLPETIIAPCIAVMMQQHPEIHFTFHNFAAYTDLAELLLRGEADIVLGIREDFDKYQGINFRIFARSEYGMLVGKGHPYFNKSVLTTDDLRGQKLVFYSSTSTGRKHTVVQLLESDGFDPTNFIFVDSPENQIYYVSTGQYLAFGGTNVHYNARLPGLVRNIPWRDCNIINGDLAVACRTGDVLANQFVDILKNYKDHQDTFFK